MLLKNFKFLIYIILFLLLLNTLFPIYSFAIDEDSIYVWSNNSSSITTSNKIIEDSKTVNTQQNSRKFFRNYFWWCYINGPKNWNCFI